MRLALPHEQIARTCLSDKSMNHKSARYQPWKQCLKRFRRHQSHEETRHSKKTSSEKTKPKQPSIGCCAISLKTSAMVGSSFMRYKPLRLLQICISEKTILPIGKTRVGERNSWITTSIEKLTWGTSYKGMNAHACHVTIIKKWSCEWKLACAIAYETMISIIVTQFSWFLRSNATCENLFKKLFPCTTQ